MITLKELINRRYSDSKECIGFEYDLPIENEKGNMTYLTIYFNRVIDIERLWKVSTIVSKNSIGELKAYNAEYQIPVKNMKLEIIAATGLNYLQYIIQQEIQYKSMIDFCIGDVVKGM